MEETSTHLFPTHSPKTGDIPRVHTQLKGRRALLWFAGAVVIFLVAALPYFRTLHHDFVAWDDDINVFENPLLPGIDDRQPGRYWAFWTAPYRNLYIPMTYTLWYALAAGSGAPVRSESGNDPHPVLNPSAFHAANVLLHGANAVLLFWLLSLILSTLRERDPHPAGTLSLMAACAAGALVFALHPVQAEPVCWVTGLKDVLCAFFCLLSLTVRVLGERTRKPWTGRILLGATLFFYVLALLSKPSAVILPLVIFILRFGLFRAPLKGALLELAVGVAVAIPVVWITRQIQPAAEILHQVPAWMRPLIALDTVTFYIHKVLYPVHLCPDYGRTPERVLASGAVWFGWFAPALAAWLLWRLKATRTQWVELLLGGVCLLPVLGLVPFTHQRYSTVTDRYLYFAMMGVALFVSDATYRALQARNPAILVFLAATLAFYGLWDIRQAGFWKDSFTLFAHTLRVNPRSHVSHNNLGHQYALMGDREKALYHYRQALDIHPGNGLAHNNLGNLYLEEGRVDQAEHNYREALSSKSDVQNALNNLGVIHYRRGDHKTAEQYYSQVLAIDPDAAQTLNNLSLILWDRGDVHGAIERVRQSLAQKPVYPAAERNLARFLALSGDPQGARTVLAQLTGEAPRSGSVAALLAEIFQEAGKTESAVVFFREAGEKAGNNAVLLNRAGYGLHQLGFADDAKKLYQRAILLDPENRVPVLNLGNLLFETGNTRGAIAFLEEKTARFPRSPEILHNLGVYWEREGDLSRAIEYLETALRVQPGYPPSLERLAKLGGGGVK